MDAGGGDPTASVSAAAATLDLNSAADVEEELVNELKDQGIFDKLRKECLNDVDTKPAYQNLKNRVDSTLQNFIRNNRWKPGMNKNQLRSQLRKQIQDLGGKDDIIDRMVDQIADPKIHKELVPQVEELVAKHFGSSLDDSIENGQDVEMEFVGENGDIQDNNTAKEGNGSDGSPGQAGQISPITPDKEGSPEVEGNMSPLTPSTTPPLPPSTKPPLPQTPPLPTEDMEVDASNHSPSDVSYTPPPRKPDTFTPPLPMDKPATPPLPAATTAAPPPPPQDPESGGEASMSSISDTEISGLSPPHHSPPPHGSPAEIPLPKTPPGESSSPGESRARAPSSTKGSGTGTGSDSDNIDQLVKMRAELMAKLEGDFKLSPEEEEDSDSDDEEDGEKKASDSPTSPEQEDKSPKPDSSPEGSPPPPGGSNQSGQSDLDGSQGKPDSSKESPKDDGKSPEPSLESPEPGETDSGEPVENSIVTDSSVVESTKAVAASDIKGHEKAAPELPTPVPTLPTPVPSLPEPVPTLPDPVPTLPDPVPTLPDPVPALPDPVPTLPDPVPTLPDPVPTLPNPVPTLPESMPTSSEAPKLPAAVGVEPPRRGPRTPEPAFSPNPPTPEEVRTPSPQYTRKGPTTPPEPYTSRPSTPPSPISSFGAGAWRPSSPKESKKSSSHSSSSASVSRQHSKDRDREKEKRDKRKEEKKSEKIKEHQKAKLAKVEQKVKSKDKLKSDKYQDLDIFSTTKKAATPHLPYRPPTVSGTTPTSALASPVTTLPAAAAAATKARSKPNDFNKKLVSSLKEAASKLEAESKAAAKSSSSASSKTSAAEFAKPGKIPERRGSSDSRDSRDSKDGKKSRHDSRESSKSRRSSVDSKAERPKEAGKSKDVKKDKSKDIIVIKEKIRDPKDSVSKDKSKDASKEQRSKDKDRLKEKERQKDKSRRESEDDKKSDSDNSKQKEREAFYEESRQRLANFRREKEEMKIKEEKKKKPVQSSQKEKTDSKGDSGISKMLQNLKPDEIKKLLLENVGDRAEELISELSEIISKKKEMKEKKKEEKETASKKRKQASVNSDDEILEVEPEKKKKISVEDSESPVSKKKKKTERIEDSDSDIEEIPVVASESKEKKKVAQSSGTKKSPKVEQEVKTSVKDSPKASESKKSPKVEPVAPPKSSKTDLTPKLPTKAEPQVKKTEAEPKQSAKSPSKPKISARLNVTVSSDDSDSDSGDIEQLKQKYRRKSGADGKVAEKAAKPEAKTPLRKMRSAKVNLSRLSSNEVSKYTESSERSESESKKSDSDTDSDFEIQIERVEEPSPAPEPEPLAAAAPTKTTKATTTSPVSRQKSISKPAEAKPVPRAAAPKKSSPAKTGAAAAPAKGSRVRDGVAGDKPPVSSAGDSSSDEKSLSVRKRQSRENAAKTPKISTPAKPKAKKSKQSSPPATPSGAPVAPAADTASPAAILSPTTDRPRSPIETFDGFESEEDDLLVGMRDRLESVVLDDSNVSVSAVTEEDLNRHIPSSRAIEVDLPPSTNTALLLKKLEELGGSARLFNPVPAWLKPYIVGAKLKPEELEMPTADEIIEFNANNKKKAKKRGYDIIIDWVETPVAANLSRAERELKNDPFSTFFSSISESGGKRARRANNRYSSAEFSSDVSRDDAEIKTEKPVLMKQEMKEEEVKAELKDDVKPARSSRERIKSYLKSAGIERPIGEVEATSPPKTRRSSGPKTPLATKESLSSTAKAEPSLGAGADRRASRRSRVTHTDASDNNSNAEASTKVEKAIKAEKTDTPGEEMSAINGSSTTAVEVEEELDLEIEETERETARVLEALKKNKAKFAKEKEPFYGWGPEEIGLGGTGTALSAVITDTPLLDEGGATFGLSDQDILGYQIFPREKGDSVLEIIMSEAIKHDIKKIEGGSSQGSRAPPAPPSRAIPTNPRSDSRPSMLRNVKDDLDLRNGSDGSDSDDKGSSSPASNGCQEVQPSRRTKRASGNKFTKDATEDARRGRVRTLTN